MRRIALRRVLPIVQIVLFLTLFWIGEAQQSAEYAEGDARQSGLTQRAKDIYAAQARAKGAVTWDLRSVWDGYEPPALQLLLAIDWPAIVLALPLALVVMPLTQALWAQLSVGAIAIGGFWYFIGRLFDRAFGDLATQKSNGRVARGGVVSWATPLISAAGFFSLWLFAGGRRWLSLSLAFWSAGVALFQFFKVRRLRSKIS